MWKVCLELLIYTLLQEISLLIQHRLELKSGQAKEIKKDYTGVKLINKTSCKL